jgi:hypothetical protein
VKPLQLFCHVVERCRYTRFILRYRVGGLTFAKLVCTSGDEECLLGTEAAFFDSYANFFRRSAEGYRKLREISFLAM